MKMLMKFKKKQTYFYSFFTVKHTDKSKHWIFLRIVFPTNMCCDWNLCSSDTTAGPYRVSSRFFGDPRFRCFGRLKTRSEELMLTLKVT